MLSQANQEIRRHLDAADARRQRPRETDAPMRYLDWVLGRLESYRLRGETRVPPQFYEQLRRTPLSLPAGITPPKRWANRIGWAAEQCFRLQGQLLRLKLGDLGQDRDDDRPLRRVRPGARPAGSSRELWWAARQQPGQRPWASLAANQPQPHRYA